MTLTPARLAQFLRPDYLHLILFPTEKCNFRCTYCYEDFEKGQMSPDVVQGIKNLILRRSDDLEEVYVSWFGGEPLMAKAVVSDVSSFVWNLGNDRGFSCRGNVTTNGYLLDPATCEALVSWGIDEYQISLDGYGTVHDRTRKRADGRGTFDRIWRNLEALHRTDIRFNVHLRIHFSPANIDNIAELVQFLVSQLSDDPRFSYVFHPIEHLGGADSTFDIYDWKASRRLMADLQSLVANPDQIHDEGLENYVCYASRANSLAVRSDGTLAKCTVALRDPRNSIGRLLPDGSIEADQSKFRFWVRGLETQDQETLACPLAAAP